MFNIGKIASSVLDSIDNVAAATADDDENGSELAIAALSRTKSVESVATNETGARDAARMNESSSHVLNRVSSDGMLLDDGTESIDTHSPSVDNANPLGSQGFSANIIEKDVDTDLKAMCDYLRNALEVRNKEIENLNKECLEYEELNNNLTLEIRQVWKDYSGLQEKVNGLTAEGTRLQLLVDQYESEQEAMGAEENRAAMKHDAQIKKLEVEWEADKLKVSVLEESLIEQKLLVESLQSQLRDQYGVVSSQSHSQDETIHRVNLEHMAAMKTQQALYNRLENEFAQCTAELVKMTSEKQQLSSQLNALGGDDSSRKEIVKLKADLTKLDAAHNLLKEKHDVARTCIKQLESDCKARKVQLDDLQAKFNSKCEQHKLELERALARASSVTDHAHGQDTSAAVSVVSNKSHVEELQNNDDLQVQLTGMSQQIIKKQGIILELQAEKSAYKSKLMDYQKKIQSLETSLSEANSNNFDYDVESSNSQVVYDKGSSAGFRSNVPGGPGFGKNNRRLVSQLQQLRLLPKDYQLVSVGGLLGKVLCVADFIDYHWVFYSLRLITSSPILRMLLFSYLILLHFWSFILIGYHASAIA